jgi:hypothetical protein
MARFGDLARIDAQFAEVQVTLKSGTLVLLNRFEAGDIDDGVRVWDTARGIVDLDARQIRTIEFASTPPVATPTRLYGTVETHHGRFNGFLQWNRQDYMTTDEIKGWTAEGEISVRYDTMAAIARHSRDSARVTLRDGRELVLSNSREVGHLNRGIAIDDARFGRVVIAWEELVHVQFTRPEDGAAYEDFAPGRPLTGTVTTRTGRQLQGRLVYDFDESETTDTLEGAVRGVSYTIPFGLVATIVPPGGEDASQATVRLHDGGVLRLDPSGDLGERNPGLLVFTAGSGHPEFVPWSEVALIAFEAPAP